MTTNYALLVIDMQLVAFDGKITPPIHNGTLLLNKISKLIDICRTHNVPIIYLQTCALSGQPYAKDTHGWEIHPDIFPTDDDRTIYKANSSGFDDTNLHETLSEIGVNGVITCGIWSEYCVTATSIAALELGYEVCIAADGHSTVSNNKEETISLISKQNDYLMQKTARVLDIQNIRNILVSS